MHACTYLNTHTQTNMNTHTCAHLLRFLPPTLTVRFNFSCLFVSSSPSTSSTPSSPSPSQSSSTTPTLLLPCFPELKIMLPFLLYSFLFSNHASPEKPTPKIYRIKSKNSSMISAHMQAKGNHVKLDRL